MTDGGDEGQSPGPTDAASDQGTLAVARRRFTESLPRKAAELRAGLALLAASPDGAKPQKEMRRRVHALLASAQVFRLEPLEDALREAVHLLDHARALGRALDQTELDQLANLCATLPALVGGSRESIRPTTPFGRTPTSRMGSIAPPTEPVAGGGDAGTRSDGSKRHSTLRMGVVSRPGDELAIAPVAPPPRSPSGSFALSQSGELAAARLGSAAHAGSVALVPQSSRNAPTVVSVLVVDGVETQSSVRSMLAVESFEVIGASDPEEALRLARSTAPDVVLADRAIVHRPGVDLVGRLRSDPLTDFVPIVLLLPPGAPNDPVAVREVGADDALERPIEPEQLRGVIAQVVSATQGAPAAPDTLPDLSLVELADRVADEVRRGIVAAAERGTDLTISLAGGGEVLAATWAAVARIRSFVSRRTSGRVRFRDPPGKGPALLALVGGGDDALPDPTAGEVGLEGRRALVVDDDPSIVWFFAGLLRSAGMTVIEAFAGDDALALARRERPELVVTDILMPGLDGFALLRELRRDLLLADVPVVVLSWKEDFLQRMRELDAPADGYLRKEVGAAETLLRVKEVLRPRARVEAALRRENDVRGRLERLGFPALVEVVARIWGDARIVLRDAAHLFELDVRDGAPVDVTRTAVDGTFARGPGAFLNLVGLRSGRFTVQRAKSPVRATLHGTLDEQLREAADRIGACIDAVSGSALVKASRVRVDDTTADAIERTSPEPMRSLIARLRDGESPRELVTSGEVDAAVLETCLVDLARRGAILAVRGLEGEDRLAEMVLARTTPRTRASNRPPRGTSEPPQPIRLSDPELRAVVLSDVHERVSSPPPMPADAVRGSLPPSPPSQPAARRESTTPARESASPTRESNTPARITDPPILRLSDPDLGLRADETPRTMGQRRTLELVGDDSALAAAVAALVAPPSEPAPAVSVPVAARASRPTSSSPSARNTPASGTRPPPLGRSDAPSAASASERPEASRSTPPSVPPIDPFELDEAFRPAVIPVPVLPLSTATARATKSDPPTREPSQPPALTASTDSVPSLDDSGELAALIADVRASVEAPMPASITRTSATPSITGTSAPPSITRASAPPATARSGPPPLAPRESKPPSTTSASTPSAPPVALRDSAPPAAAKDVTSALEDIAAAVGESAPPPRGSAPPAVVVTPAAVTITEKKDGDAPPPTAGDAAPKAADAAPKAADAAPHPPPLSSRRDPSDPEIEITVGETPSRASDPAPRPSRPPDAGPPARPVVDGALPSVIVAAELDPIITNMPAAKAARMGLVPGAQPSGSGGLFVLVLILVGLGLIVLLGWSMAKRRTPEPTSPAEHGILESLPPPRAARHRDDVVPVNVRPLRDPAPPAPAIDPAAHAIDAPAPTIVAPVVAPTAAPTGTGTLRLLLPDGLARRPLPYEVHVDGRRVHRSDIVSQRDMILERALPAGVHEVRVRRGTSIAYRTVYVAAGSASELDLRR